MVINLMQQMARCQSSNQNEQQSHGHRKLLSGSKIDSVRTSQFKDLILTKYLFRSMPPHPNLVQTFGVCMESEFPYIVLEYCDGGSLDKVVFNRVLACNEQRALVLGIAYGLTHLHEHKIVHRDLAARNILVRSGYASTII